MAKVIHEAQGTAWPKGQFSWVSVLAYSREVKSINERQMRKKFLMT